MQRSVLVPLAILIIAGVGAFFLVGNKLTNYSQPTSQSNDNDILDISTGTIWNAYTLNGTTFIYPSDWTFEELRDPVGGFKVTYPVSSNSFDTIEAGGTCPEVTIPEIHNACINGIWLHTQSESPFVHRVFEDMKKFGESQAKY